MLMNIIFKLKLQYSVMRLDHVSEESVNIDLLVCIRIY